MYKLDTEAAKQADSTGNRISEKGRYVGKFTRAQHIVSQEKRTQGIDFDFETSDGQKARFSIYTQKADGTTIYGYKQLMALMTCLKVRELADPKPMRAKVYDYDEQKEVEKEVPQFRELLGRDIGILLVMDEYKADKWRPSLAGAFNAQSEQVAREILEGKTVPEMLEKMVAHLKDKPLKQSNTNEYADASAGSSTAHGGGFEDMSDDIPF